MTKNDLSKWASEVDLGATRTVIAELEAKGKPWLPKIQTGEKGKYANTLLRICPKRPEWDTPYKIVAVHYGIGPSKQMVVCLKAAGIGECPACQLRWELESKKDKKGAQGLRASVRTFMNVVCVNEDGSLVEEKIYLLGLNKLQFLGKRGFEPDLEEEGELPLFYFFEIYGDLSHVETGRGIRIKAKDEQSGDYDTIKMKFSVADPSPFPGTSEWLEEELTNLHEVVRVFEANDMLALIEGRAGGAILPVVEGEVVAQIEAPSAASTSLFSDDEDDDATPAAESAEEETPHRQPPETDPKAAMARLNQHLENGKSE